MYEGDQNFPRDYLFLIFRQVTIQPQVHLLALIPVVQTKLLVPVQRQ